MGTGVCRNVCLRSIAAFCRCMPRLTQVVPLSSNTRIRLEAIFRLTDRPEAEKMLVEECADNLPFLEDADQIDLERFRFAALKLSEGRLDKLRSAVHLAKVDWRDLLMAAGFGEDVDAHLGWMPA